jgi:hypothetical protein
MHITPLEGSSSTKKKVLAFKASQEKRGKEKVFIIVQVTMKLMMQVLLSW